MTLLPSARPLARGRTNPAPLYVQVREALRRDITTRQLRPGDQLPTESELEQQFAVSRATIRQAVGELEAEGVLRRVQGRGTFVAAARIHHLPELTSFTELLRSQGYTPSHELLETRVSPAPDDVAEGLGIEPGAPCRLLLRSFAADGEPVGLGATWLPQALIAQHDAAITAGAAAGRSLYEVLGEADERLVPQQALESIDATLASVSDAGRLGCQPGVPLLVILRTSRNLDDVPVEWTRLRFLPGRYGYRVELVRPGTRSAEHG